MVNFKEEIAKEDDARYTGSFFTSYTNTRMKLHRHCVPLDDNPSKIAEIYGYDEHEVSRIFAELEEDLQRAADELREAFGSELSEKLAGRRMNLVFIGDQLTSEYLSYYNILKRALKDYPDVELSIAGNTGDTSNQSVQYIYGLAVSQAPVVTSIFIGSNDAFRSNDMYRKTVASREEFGDNVDYLTKVMLHNGSKVILNTLPPVDEEAVKQAYAHMNLTIENEELAVRNQLILEIAEKNHCAVNDIAACLEKFDGKVQLPENGMLLTKEAQLAIAKQFTSVLLSQL